MNQVGGYTLGKVIGMGASSKVRLGIKATSLEKVAVKSIDKLKLADERRTQTEVKVKIRQTLASPQKQAVIREMGGLPENTSDFDKCEVESIESSVECITSLAEEVKLLMRLKHPNIIQIYEVIETSSELHLVLEFAPNGNFADFIKDKGGKIDETTSRPFFQQIVSAVDHCHAAGVAHRDLKMENMLLNAQNQILLTDFGLGRSLLASNISETYCGTPSHAAVEITLGIPYNAKMADIWSLGIILYIMIAGNNPFAAGTIHQLYKRVRALDYSFPDGFSMDLRDLISRILVKNPNERLSIVEVARHFWIAQGDTDWYKPTIYSCKSRESSIFSISSDSHGKIYKFRSDDLSKKEATKIFSSMRTASSVQIRRRAASDVKSSAPKTDGGSLGTARVKTVNKDKCKPVAANNEKKTFANGFTSLFKGSKSVNQTPLRQSLPETPE